METGKRQLEAFETKSRIYYPGMNGGTDLSGDFSQFALDMKAEYGRIQHKIMAEYDADQERRDYPDSD